METEARYFLIGLFSTVMLSAGAIFTIWFGGFSMTSDAETYDIYFLNSVSGLSVGGTVRYSGVFVGQVSDIRFDPDNASRIRVTIEVVPETPIFRDTVATLELQGLTGVVYVQLVNSDPGEEPLEIAEGQDYPVIQSAQSKFDQLFSGAPDVINGGISALERINRMLSDENLAHVANILEKVETITASLEEPAKNIQPLMAELSAALTDVEEAANAIEKVAASADGFIKEDLPALKTQLSETLSRLDGAIEKAGSDITGFTSTALPELSDFVSDARRVSATLNRIAERFERSPIDFVFSGDTPTVELD